MTLLPPIARFFNGPEGIRPIHLAVIFLIAGKWLLISNNEIVSEQYDPYQYLVAAKVAGFTDGSLHTLSPGYPIWLKVTSLTGIPQRLTIEILWIFSCLLFSVTLAKYSTNKVILPISLGVLLFAPPTLFLFDRILSEGIFLCLTVLLATTFIWLLKSETRERLITGSCAVGLVSGIMLITRNEGPLINAYIVLMALAWTIIRKFQGNHNWLRLARDCLLITIISLSTAALPRIVCSGYNYIRYGVYTVNLAEMPSHMGMLKRLASIDTATEGQRFIPISSTSRQMAYSVSSSLSVFQPIVENPANIYQKTTHDTYGTSGEIGAGWIWHIFNQAAPEVGASSPYELNTLYRRINDELDTAFDDGRLKKRFVPHPFLGADTTAWLSYLPEGFVHSLQCVISPAMPMLDRDYGTELFDRMCLRRQSLIPRGSIRIEGWAFARNPSEGSPISRIVLNYANGTTHEVFPERLARPDVRNGFAQQGIKAPADSGFRAKVANYSSLVALTFIAENGAKARWEYPATNRAVSLDVLSDKAIIEAGLDWLDTGKPAWDRGARASVFKTLMHIGSSPIAWCVALLSAPLSLAWRCLGSARPRITPLFIASLIFMVCSAGRVAFYAIITAGAWQAETRYLQPAAVLTLCAVLTAWTCAMESKAVTPKIFSR